MQSKTSRACIAGFPLTLFLLSSNLLGQDDTPPAPPAAAIEGKTDDVAVKSISEESWGGWLETELVHLRLVIKTAQAEDGTTVGAIISPDQSPIELPLMDVKTSDDGGIAFQVQPPGSSTAGYSFDGKRTEDVLEGVIVQGDRKDSIRLFRLAERFSDSPATLGADSVWSGELNAITRKLNLRFRIYSKPPFGNPEAPKVVFDSVDERVNGIPVVIETGDKQQAVLRMAAIKAQFSSTFSSESNSITGRFSQGLLPLPLTIRRNANTGPTNVIDDPLVLAVNKAEVSKPAEKSDDESNTKRLKSKFRQEEFVIEIDNYLKPRFDKDAKRLDNKYKLAGTMTWPANATPDNKVPAVVMITGSGPQDRDETIGKHKPFHVLAEALAEQGVASLRFDDRGVGESTGDFLTATSSDFAVDAYEVWKHAASIPGIDRRRIGLLGHSEGGIIAPIVAAWNSKVAFMILIAPPALPGSEILKSQIDRIMELQGTTETERKIALDLQSELQRVAIEFDPSDDSGDFEARQVIGKRWEAIQSMSKEPSSATTTMEKKSEIIKRVMKQFQQLRGPWTRHFLMYDPAPNWLMFECPTLAIWGEKDVQVLPEPNVIKLRDAIEHNPPLVADFVVLPGLNHLLQSCDTGLPDEYVKIDETISPIAIQTISNWLMLRDLVP